MPAAPTSTGGALASLLERVGRIEEHNLARHSQLVGALDELRRNVAELSAIFLQSPALPSTIGVCDCPPEMQQQRPAPSSSDDASGRWALTNCLSSEQPPPVAGDATAPEVPHETPRAADGSPAAQNAAAAVSRPATILAADGSAVRNTKTKDREGGCDATGTTTMTTRGATVGKKIHAGSTIRLNQMNSLVHVRTHMPFGTFLSEFDSNSREIPPITQGISPFAIAISSRCVHWLYFDYIIGIVIFVNSIAIGWEAAAEVHGDPPAFLKVMEPIFLTVYVCELAMRLIADGLRKNLARHWVRFDMLLVSLGFFSMCIIRPLRAMDTGESSVSANSMVSYLEWVLIFRIMRLLRLLRALRLLSQFKMLWRLVQGLMNSVGMMLSTLALLLFVIYVFACIGVEFITKDNTLRMAHNTEVVAILDDSFASLPGVMLTLIQFVTLDSVSSLYGPLIEESPWLLVYFLPVILFIPVTLMNLVTAGLVEAAGAMASEERELVKDQKRTTLLSLTPEIQTAFRRVDQDRSGKITEDEILNAWDHLPQKLRENIDDSQVVLLFETLDMDGSGEVSETEFVEGILHYLTSDIPVETLQSLKLLHILKEKLNAVETAVFGLPSALRRNIPDGRTQHATQPRSVHLAYDFGRC